MILIPTNSGGPQPVPVEYIVVAGGGAGDNGGGGAGGLLYSNTFIAQPSTNYTLTVGAGGTGATSTVLGTNGGNSTFGSAVAIGGGSGGHFYNWQDGRPGIAGGSGGGAAGPYNGGVPGGAGTAGQGNKGGDGGGQAIYSSGGGGGAGAAGQNANTLPSTGGNGGNGLYYFDGYYAGGGGGSRINGGTQGSGGLGGGGTGGVASTLSPTSGTANTGGGGGGVDGDYTRQPAGNGGSGIVILKVPAGSQLTFSAGVSQTSTTAAGYTTYKITAAGASDTVKFG